RFQDEFDAQLQMPARPSAEVLVPKLVDFDGTDFRYDEHQPFKQPDWTYATPQPATAKPARKPRGHVAIRISPDLERQLRSLADERGVPIDRLVDQALRDWLSQPR